MQCNYINNKLFAITMERITYKAKCRNTETVVHIKQIQCHVCTLNQTQIQNNTIDNDKNKWKK